jgi:hypothetical protein
VSRTGVSIAFTACHVDRIMTEGEHEHTWRITAWFPGEPFRDARALREQLRMTVAAWPNADGVLPEELWSGEQMAAQLMNVLMNCIGIDIDRPDEGFHVRARL